MNNLYIIEIELKNGTTEVFKTPSRDEYMNKIYKLDSQLEKGKIRGYLGTVPDNYNPFGLLDEYEDEFTYL